MKILKSITVLGLFIVSCASLFAQESKSERTPEERAEKMTEKMSTEFSLDEKATAELKALNFKFVSDMQRIKSDESMGKDQQKAEIKQISETHDAGIKNLLTEEQFALYEQNKAEKKAEYQAKNQLTPEERAAKKTAHIKELCTLTADQEAKVSELNIRVEQKIEVIRKDESMSEDRKKEFIKGNRKDQMNVLKSILTPEQVELLKAENHKFEDQ